MTPREQLSKKARRKLETLERRHAKLEVRIAILMSLRVELEEKIASVYDESR